jgi:hypothetical protein
MKPNELFPEARISKPMSLANDLTTTKDALVFNNVGISRNTIEKLTAFRYQAPQQDSSQPQEINHDPTIVHWNAADKQNLTHATVDAEMDDMMLYSDFDVNSDFHMPVPDNQAISRPLVGKAHSDEDILVTAPKHSELHSSQRGELSLLQFDSDDEFPIDDGDEAEMAQLPLLQKPNKLGFSHSSDPRNELEGEPSSGSRNGYYRQLHLSSPTSHTLSGDKVSADVAQRMTPEFESLTDITPYSVLNHENTADYQPMPLFARPNFPDRVLDRSPIIGISNKTALRTCFRIGEALRVGKINDGLGQETVIELFARVGVSTREARKTKQRFHFVDLFHDHPPYLDGVLDNYKVSALQDTESRLLQGDADPSRIIRCLGWLKRVVDGKPGWIFHIINIRPTDWEEVRWTKKIAGAGEIRDGNGAKLLGL